MHQVWANNVTASGVNYASMLNTGNFVLARQDYVYLWESFYSPTDTILPTQVLNQGSILVSRVSETNYSNGNFQFLVQSDGDLVLSLVDVTHNFVRYKYWQSSTFGAGFQFFFNQSSTIYLMARNGTILDLISRNPVSTTDFF
ncbi:g-type lectin s-receptor-like serine/threonine-protein kinase lecrk2 [Quercus suber]|uniref:G-type lectin s-receptor-like serine/threonine-protein kinase lecrk2 n=1 Tax=Quercus suber TaxID=58331 RepID=A0AAW0M6G1_QUESU